MPQARQLVLASTSRYRAELLSRLGLRFEQAAPSCDETPMAGESPQDTALRLAYAKARSIADRYPAALIVGSDQVAALGGSRLGKPGTHERAAAQLRELSGREAHFHTAVCLLDAASGESQTRLASCRVAFRELDSSRIEAYLAREQPYDCAGSAKSEGLGIALIARIDGDDPTALVGLPLIALVTMLERAGLPVLQG